MAKTGTAKVAKVAKVAKAAKAAKAAQAAQAAQATQSGRAPGKGGRLDAGGSAGVVRARSAKGRGRQAPGSAYKTLEVDIRNQVALLSLARPDVHNAFNETLIAELTHALCEIDTDEDVRAVVLLAHGKSFCAGADLHWMKRMAGYNRAENLTDARALATMLETLYRMGKPTIARVHGPAYGGGVGLAACCDIVVAAQEATFALTEVKLGLIPATIGPYVVEAIGARQARRYFLSAERFTAAEAFRIGLVHEIVPQDELDARINELLGALFLAGPRAQGEAKALIRGIAHRPIADDVIAGTAERIAAVRSSPEGKEGVAAFLDKRDPAWVPAALRRK